MAPKSKIKAKAKVGGTSARKESGTPKNQASQSSYERRMASQRFVPLMCRRLPDQQGGGWELTFATAQPIRATSAAAAAAQFSLLPGERLFLLNRTAHSKSPDASRMKPLTLTQFLPRPDGQVVRVHVAAPVHIASPGSGLEPHIRVSGNPKALAQYLRHSLHPRFSQEVA